ncbi:MAG TPA: twin-arginine translocation signal domain-containing protein [Candidatus Aminicenantes bacterium]|nr:twin-arginine translocation signal domain-containing protein [Candidatus Aminicenantes bacterium]HEB35174.1 twin-arginine translocation signal domain-containing protein [Candidatus Aminicenantes bacterium]
MNRRSFLKSVAATGASAAFLNSVPGRAKAKSNSSSTGIVVDGLNGCVLDKDFLARARKGGVHCVVKGLSFGRAHDFVARNPKDITIATTVREIRDAKDSGKLALVFDKQMANDVSDAMRKSNSYLTLTYHLRAQYEAGLRIQGICYNLNNLFGGGCMDHKVPLTRAGRRLVEEIHRLNIILDIGGHTGEQTSLDAIAMSKGVPVVNTHTNPAALCANPRNISDRLAVAIAKTGGVIGISTISDFHNLDATTIPPNGAKIEQATLNMHLDHYDYFKKLVGVDHVGMGTDLIVGSHSDEKPWISVTFPPDASGPGVILPVKDFESLDQLPNLIRGLKGRGWSASELDKVLGANWLRVYERVWGA